MRNLDMRIGSLFSGVGGLELGLEWAGIGHTVWQVEMNPFCREIGSVAKFAGVSSLISYTRVDEKGSCYLGSGYEPVALVHGRKHNTGNRKGRYLPGLEPQSTEVIDRVRWELNREGYESGLIWDKASGRWSAMAPALVLPEAEASHG